MKKSGVYQGDEDPSKMREKQLKSKVKSKENKRKSKVKSKVVTEGEDGKTKEKTKVVTNKKTGDVTTKKKKVTKGPEGRKKSKTKKTTNPQDDAFKRMIESSFKYKSSPGKYDDEEPRGDRSIAKQSKPDYIDIDGDGDKKESMKKAAVESPAKKMNHSMAYKADYDKDMAEERIKIKDAKEDIYEDDKEKRDSMATRKSFAMQFSEKSPMARFKDFDQMDSYDAKKTAGESPAQKHGAMKGDQSATHTDYANYEGTDKGYHGKDGSSHGDQSATQSDYRSRMTRNSK